MSTQVMAIPRGERTLRALVRRERPLPAGQPGDEGGTVLLEAGLGLDSGLWEPFLALVDSRPGLDGWRFVAGDRAGLGGSEPSPDPRPLSAVVADMDAMVTTLGRGPLVLVGHSWGGTLARLWCAAHPGQACGIVLVDASFENGPEHHRAQGLGWLGRGLEVLATDALEAASAPLAQQTRTAAHARTQEMRLFGPSLDVLSALATPGRTWLPERQAVVTTSRRRGRQFHIQEEFARRHGATLVAASSRHHLLPLTDPGAVMEGLREVLPPGAALVDT
ncbi:MAG: alpha/beta fold hydrolase [Actinomyces sp.]|nr:alpha/beta fold hydrolase [Actinomyces sp.]